MAGLPSPTSFPDPEIRLGELELEVEPLRDVVRQSYLAFVNCTRNHPPLVRGIWAWGEAVRALRDYVVPLGWRRSDEQNYALVVHDDRKIAIVVATGDDATGDPHRVPTTKAPKGSSTLLAVVVNKLQLSLFSDGLLPEGEPGEREDITTYMLLIHRAGDEVRCELSVPSSMDDDGWIDGWSERIILPAVPLDGDLIQITPPDLPDIDVEVKRRA